MIGTLKLIAKERRRLLAEIEALKVAAGNPASVLGKLAKGKKKTMTPAALKARKLNAKKPRPRAKQSKAAAKARWKGAK